MKRKTNIIGTVLTVLVVGATLFLLGKVVGNKATGYSFALNVLFLLLGALLSGILCAFMHEGGHALAAKKNGFTVAEFKVWFFRWKRQKNGYDFSFTLPLDEAGATVTVPKTADGVEKRLIKVTFGGLIASLISMLIGIPALFFYGKIPFVLFCIWATFLPVGAYYFFGNAFPMSTDGVFNDGGVIFALKKSTPEGRVLAAILKIQAELYADKTPAEIDEKLYFDLPQIAEDSPYFINLLTLRYNYYLDKNDFVNAEKTVSRLLYLEDYMTKPVWCFTYSIALYNACTFNYNEDKADDYTAEIEKYLNADNSVTNLRIKAAYVLYVRKEKDVAERFIEKGLKDVSDCLIKGLGRFEEKLLLKIKNDLEN